MLATKRHVPKRETKLLILDYSIFFLDFSSLFSVIEKKGTTVTLRILIPHNLSFLLVLVNMACAVRAMVSMLWHF